MLASPRLLGQICDLPNPEFWLMASQNDNRSQPRWREIQFNRASLLHTLRRASTSRHRRYPQNRSTALSVWYNYPLGCFYYRMSTHSFLSSSFLTSLRGSVLSRDGTKYLVFESSLVFSKQDTSQDVHTYSQHGTPAMSYRNATLSSSSSAAWQTVFPAS